MKYNLIIAKPNLIVFIESSKTKYWPLLIRFDENNCIRISWRTMPGRGGGEFSGVYDGVSNGRTKTLDH